MFPRKLVPALYALWIGGCALLFLLLAGAEDPSRPTGRMLSLDAAAHARAILARSGQPRYRSYEVVHVARARKGEGGERERWVVLLDASPRTALRQAVVVELDASSGDLIAIRPALPPAR